MYPKDAWELLSPQLTDKRRQRMIDTVSRRTNYIRLVVQDVHQPHNVSACIRSAEGFGIQNIDVVTLKTKFDTSTVARGVDHWVHINKHPSVKQCVDTLHNQGYLVAAAFPYGDAIALDELPIDKPIALAFGNEHEGLSKEWLELSDVRFTIPMSGIVESLNISVCAAISMYTTSQRALKKLSPERYFLNETQKNELLNEWICRQITSWEGQIDVLRRRKLT
ncbi:MAG: RNA methyltransferase [Proteobacteria bacterium]|nr:RNA methyltransferase [Pseudomonadota bacterium]